MEVSFRATPSSLFVDTTWEDGSETHDNIALIIVDAANRYMCRNSLRNSKGNPLWTFISRKSRMDVNYPHRKHSRFNKK